MLSFTKMNGAGNDFVLLDNRDGQIQLDPASIEQLCDRHSGIGADGLLAVETAQNGADFRMRYYNSDGGEAEMCGNGARCFARFAQRLSGQAGELSFETLAGVITARFFDRDVEIQMSEPRDLRLNEEVALGTQAMTVHSVNTGVPHTVTFVNDLENTEVRSVGAALRRHSHFAPKGTNVNFVNVLSASSIAVRTYERGVEDETLACGTGMVAAALVTHVITGATSPISVRVRGGDSLKVAFEKVGASYRNVLLTGPADFVFEGQVEI